MDININHPVWSPIPTDADSYANLGCIECQIKFTRLAVRALLGKDKKGVVALVSSIAGYSSNFSCPLYCATKHAVVGFTRSMRDAEQMQGVKVVSVCPGYVLPSHQSPFYISPLTLEAES